MADLAAAGEGLGAAPRRRLRPLLAFTGAFAAEGDRRILWLPVFFGTGIALYFTLTSEPSPWIGGAATIAAAAVAVALRRWPVLRNAGIALAFVASGFAVMQQTRLERGTPMLERRLGPAAITGRVVDIDPLDRGWRIIVVPDPLAGLAADAQPHRLRLHIAATSDPLRPGDRVSLKGLLYPVPAQLLPGGRDMQRELYFAGIGGVGYSYGAAHRIAAADENTGGGWREWLLRLRAEMTARINAALPGSTGGVASAVITGKRGTMAEEVKEAFRQSGLSHLLAIAGLHLGLVGGFVFFAVRGGLALVPFLALRYPIKKIAAVVTLIAVYETWGTRLAYLFHSGSFARKALGYVGAVAVTTLVATIGTEPFSIYHFHHLALYSPLANVIAVPLSAMWTLPWGVIACLLMPLGLERLALVPMGWGIDVTIAVAQWVAALPGNVWSMPRLPTSGVVLVALGGSWLCLWQGRWRWWGSVGIAAGMATMLLTRPPDLILADFGRFLAARAPDGNYLVADTGEKLTRSFLVQETGASLLPWPAAASSAGALDCPAEGRCFYAAHARRVALVTGEAGLPVACNTVDAIVAQVPAGFQCRSQIPVVDRIDSWRQGAIALWLEPGGVRVESTNAGRGDRPWVPHPVSARERARAAER